MTGAGRIHFRCPHCDKAIAVAVQHAGKQGKCPGCAELLQVPTAPPPRDDDEDAAYALLKQTPEPTLGLEPSQPLDFSSVGSNPIEDRDASSTQRGELNAGAASHPHTSMIVCLVIAAVSTLLCVVYALIGRANNFLTTLSWISGCMATVAWIVSSHGFVSRCPKCHGWWAGRRIAKTPTRKQHVWKTETRSRTYLQSRTWLGKRGISYGVGQTTRYWQVRVEYIRKHFDILWRCRYCSDQWATTTYSDTRA